MFGIGIPKVFKQFKQTSQAVESFQPLKLVLTNFVTYSMSLSSRGGLGVERLLQKEHDSAPVDQSLLEAWYRLYVF